ncbi:PLP-dependent transferase [Escherichia marmotae]|nr:PLP-dependent transferase [Escherichia marmotae]
MKTYTLGAVNSVIQRASSLVFDSVEAKKHATRTRANGELFYGRRGTLTHFSLQQAMCELEGGAGCALFPADIVKHLQPNTKIVFLESPGSITMEVHDVPAIVAAVRSVVPDAIIMIDNTWAAGVLFKALDFGIDVSIQAATKYLVGHSDAMIGTAVCNARCWEQLRENAYLMGQMVDADTAYITSRGLRTLGVRLRQHHESSLKVAEWLAEHPQVARVNHPALPGSKGHEFWKRDFTGSSGQVSLVLANQPEHIAAIRPQGEIDFSGTLIRLHIGLEDVDDLIADLDAGFARIV